METKAALRREIAARQMEWTPAYLRASDAAIVRRVLALPAWAEAAWVFAYVSVRREPDTRALIRAALAAGKRVAVPRCLGDGLMEAREIHSLDALEPAAFGLLEPGADAPRVAPEALDLALVPCVGADRQGRRLGHGAGYYDRFLRDLRAARVCLCRSAALLEAAPAEPHDVRMDWIICEDGTIEIKGCE